MKVLVVTGEVSGDLHGANLLAALERVVSGVEAFGIGGERLRAAGLECLARSEELSVMGLAEVVRELPRLLGLSRRVRREALARRPDVAVLVDSPDFNLPLADHLHAAGVPVVVYISPQLWAWRQGRVRRIRRVADRVLCILPFEVDFYERHGVPAEYVGHPLVDELAGFLAEPVEREPGTVALLPGSRWHEVSSLLPAMLAALRLLRRDGLAERARLIVAPGLDRERLAPLLRGEDVEIILANRHRTLATSSVAMVASGTATLECALLNVPMVVTYRLHPLTYALARRLVKVPHVGLVNLVAGRGIAPELVQEELKASALAREIAALLGEEGDRQRAGLAEVRDALGAPGASERAARAVVNVVEAKR